MNSENKTPAMSQMIFSMNLPVETVSLYLLCCGFSDAETPISLKNLANVWNSTAEALEAGLKDLENKNIIHRIVSDQKDNVVYKLTDDKDWKIDG